MAGSGASARLKTAAEDTVTSALDRFPPLIIYRSLGAASAKTALADAAEAHLRAANPAVSEVLAIPRRGFGSRPVEILSPTSRTAFGALVGVLDDSLVEPSRTEGAWKAHREFGRQGDHTHVVELDYASCYELIDHIDLRQELLLRSFDIDTLDAVSALLAGVGHHGRGLPQMLTASDRLADTYLSVLDRSFARAGYSAHRFADDFRILANDWPQAMAIIDLAAATGRTIGLVLSASKTAVWLRGTLVEQEDERVSTLSAFIDDADNLLTEWVDSDPYEMPEGVPGDRADVFREAMWTLLESWATRFRVARDANGTADGLGDLNGFVGMALIVLKDHGRNLPEDMLGDLIFADPTRYAAVSRYLLARLERDESDYVADALTKLCSAGRSGPWEKLWTLHLIEELGDTLDSHSPLDEWVKAAVHDPHELVRAQAAWVLATRGALTDADVQLAYRHATEISMHALAAACSAQNKSAGQTLDSKLAQAIRNDGRLNKEAYEWGA